MNTDSTSRKLTRDDNQQATQRLQDSARSRDRQFQRRLPSCAWKRRSVQATGRLMVDGKRHGWRAGSIKNGSGLGYFVAKPILTMRNHQLRNSGPALSLAPASPGLHAASFSDCASTPLATQRSATLRAGHTS
jgi:hypothetical protein